MAYWICPVCGYEAANDNEKQEHMKLLGQDNLHKKVLKERLSLGVKGGSARKTRY
ncbi:MAG: hypothetical protein ACOX6V_02190 [Patescibacteria group bacterium]|jgi:hypothetical protein